MFKSALQKVTIRPKAEIKKVEQPTSPPKQNHPILNGKYFVKRKLGDGITARVYLCESVNDSGQQYAMKVMRDEFLKKDQRNLKMVQNEVSILKGLNHKGIVKLIEFGEKGCVQKSSGQITDNLVYLLMEYIPGGTLFNLCERSGQMGEDIGRFFLHQFVDVIQDMHNQNIVHRDIKLENILINDDMSIKFADFGFARKQEDCLLKS